MAGVQQSRNVFPAYGGGVEGYWKRYGANFANHKADKEWFVQNHNRPGVQDPTLPDSRIPISVTINGYIDALIGAKATKKAHRHDLREFDAWNDGLERRKKKYVEEIDKAHMRRFFEYLVDDEPENCPFTAAWKLMRVNKFIRTVLQLDPGKGPMRKSD